MENSLISVIVPIYNTKEYLTRCVHSIMAQTYAHLEILLVDDGSTDGTGELCDMLAAEDFRIRVYHKKNGGSSSARNVGLKLARGEYIGFVDSDDYIDPDMYGRLYRGIVEYRVKAAQIGRDEIDGSGKLLPDICVPPREPECIRTQEFLRELLMHRGDCSFCTKLLHRSLFGLAEREVTAHERQPEGTAPALCFPEGALNEDFHLLIQMLPAIGQLVSLPGYAYHVFYRVGSNSRKAEREDFSRVFADGVDNADMAAGIVRADYPELEKTVLRFGVFQRLEYLLHIPISRMTGDNAQYRAVVGWLRRHLLQGITNPYLTSKNKCYQILFAIAPRGIRRLHRALGRAGSAATE